GADLVRDAGDPLLHRLAVLGGDLQQVNTHGFTATCRPPARQRPAPFRMKAAPTRMDPVRAAFSRNGFFRNGGTRRASQLQAMAVAGSSRIQPTSARNFEPSSPSTSRWSKDSPSVVTCRGLIFPLCTHGCSRIAPNARIAASPGLRIG